ncbi:MAG: protease complex subunit PrcB family protein [Candidatus Thorarchaeota archaeon]|nr:protease complex subunit PrcB family protein [Candidatus Thorarchaeota archaeon]
MISRQNVIGCIIAVLLLASSMAIYLISADPGYDVNFNDFHQGTRADQIEEERNVVVTDNETWTDLWIEMHHVNGLPPPTPYVNFTSEWLIAVFLGIRPSGGYSVNITRIGRSLFSYKVYYEELAWQELAISIETYPFHIVKISSSPPDLPVQFIYSYVPVYPPE